jgi:hypothetical protein
VAAQQRRPTIEPIVTEDWHKCGVALFPLLLRQAAFEMCPRKSARASLNFGQNALTGWFVHSESRL